MNNKKLLITRGRSGSGKTSFVQNILSNPLICCADDYFVDENGVYNFKAEELGKAHAQCRKTFDNGIAMNFPLIVIANTNTTQKEWQYYENVAKQHGYDVYFIVIENRHGNLDVHGTPEEVKNRQRDNIIANISL